MLKFSRGNAKLDKLEEIIGGEVWTFSLLAGWSCPFAEQCLSRAIEVDGKRRILDGQKTKFRCFSASQEVLYTPVYNARKHNFDLIKACKSEKAIVELIQLSLPKRAKAIRVHVSGDFFSVRYFRAWMKIAELYPNITFYGYTKATPYLVKYRDDMPANFRFVASYGGKRDDLIAEHNLRYAKVIDDETQANGLPIDHDDSYALLWNENFALLKHGTQPKGVKQPKYGYRRGK